MVLGVQGQHHAGVDRLAVAEHGAGAALGPVADLLGAGEVELVAEDVEQGPAGLDVHPEGAAIDPQLDGEGLMAFHLLVDLQLGVAHLGGDDHGGGAGAHSLQEAPAGKGEGTGRGLVA